MFEHLLKRFEPELKMRGVSLFFIIDRELTEGEQFWLKNKLKDELSYDEIFPHIEVKLFPNYLRKKSTYLKIYCTAPNLKIRNSQAIAFYKKIFEEYTKLITESCSKYGINGKIDDFRISFQIEPIESKDIIEIPDLNEINKSKLIREKAEQPPKTATNMLNYALKVVPLNKEQFEAVTQHARDNGAEVFGTFGFRTNYSTELDITVHSLSENATNFEEMNDTAVRLKNKGQLHYAGALNLYDTILSKEPSNEPARLNKGVLLKNMDKVGEAIKIYDQILAKDPNNFFALANKGAALQRLMKYDEALKYYDKALKICPTEAVLIENKKNLLKIIKTPKQRSKTETLMDKAMTDYLLDNFDQAQLYCDKVLQENPHSKDALQLKAVILVGKAVNLIDKAEFMKALAILEKCFEINPKSPEVYLNIGFCYERLKKYDEALINYNKALKLDPNNPTALNNKGYFLFIIGKYDEAIELFDSALKITPFDIRIINNKVKALEALSRQN